MQDQGQRSEILREAVRLGKNGLFLDARDLLAQCGSLRQWQGADRTEVSWIVSELGAPRLARWHVLKSYREAPQSLAVRVAYGSEIAEHRGPLDCLEFLESTAPPTDDDDAEDRMHWHWLFGISYSLLRDFDAAEQQIEMMQSIGTRPDTPLYMRAHWLERQDRYDDAIDAIDQSLALYDGRRSLAYKAHLLSLVGRDEEAYELLSRTDARMQCSSFSWQMSAYAYERQDFAECERLMTRFDELTPLRERAFAERFRMFRSELARRRGDDAAAIEFARQTKSEYGNKIAQRLADPHRRDRVDKILPVTFVRQHEITCGPATLSAVSQFWGMETEHLEVAEAICYNGTSNHAERSWADQNGFVTREFAVTEEATEQLIGRGLPFTLVTRGAGNAHLQAVIGYDGRTGMILIRDPYHRVRGSAPADELIENQIAHGPRGMVMVPADRAELLDGLDLPDAKLYDLLHAFDGALIRHDRNAAIGILDELRTSGPGHRLTLQAERQLGMYDGDDMAIYVAVKKLSEMYPKDESLRLTEISLLGQLGRISQRIERLRELAAEPLPHPMCLLQLGESLTRDGRFRDEAEQLLRSAIRKGPAYARAYCELADLWWLRNQRSEAFRLYRFAACLDEKDEFLASRYLDAAIVLGRAAEVIDWLSRRFEQLGGRSMLPATTLFAAYERLSQDAKAIEVLESAIEKRPDDAELKVFVAQSLASASGEYWPRVERLLAEAKPGASQRAWCETTAYFEMVRGEYQSALDTLRSLLPRSPLSLSLREQITDLISRVEGDDAAIEHWRQAASDHAHFQPLVERYAMSLRDRPVDVIAPVLEGILEVSPENGWATRELSQHLLLAGRLDEADQMICRAEELDSEHSFVVFLRASLMEKRGDQDAARALLRQRLTVCVNDDFLVSKLLEFCNGVDETAGELRWVADLMRQQPITGDLLQTFRSYAEGVLPDEELLSELRDALQIRGDLWHAHQSVIRQLVHMDRLADAADTADQATEKFPLEPNSWYERYLVASAAGDQALQRSMLEKCRQLRPKHSIVLRALSDLDCSEGRFAEACEILQTLAAEQPLDAINHGYLGDVLFELDRYEEAIEHFQRSVELLPAYEYGWGQMDAVANRLDRPDHRLEVAKRLSSERPHDAACWLELGRELSTREDYQAADQALTRAESINPYSEDVHLMRARMRVNSGDFDGALSALQPAVYPVIPPSLDSMRAQLLWDLGQREPAYALIKQTVATHPTFSPGWSRLQGWAIERNDRPEAIRAIEQQIAANPHDPDVLNDAGEAFADFGDADRAIASLQRTIEISPGYTGSRCRLFDLLIADSQWDRADVLLKDLPRQESHPAVIARQMRVRVHRKQTDQLSSMFQQIISSDDWSGWAVDQGLELMSDAGMRIVARDAIQEKLQDPGSEKSLGGFWADEILSDQNRPEAARVTAVVDRTRDLIGGVHVEAGEAAISSLVTYLNAQDSPKPICNLIREHRSWLFENTHCWALVAFAYADKPKWFSKRERMDWVSDWKQREGIKAWMMTNVHEVLRLSGDLEQARQAVSLGVSMPPDLMHSQLRLWAAHDALSAGDVKQAIHHFMSAARLEDLAGTDRLMHHWIESSLHILEATDKASALAEVKRQTAELALPNKFFADQPVYREPMRTAMNVIASAAGSIAAKCWAKWQLAKMNISTIVTFD